LGIAHSKFVRSLEDHLGALFGAPGFLHSRRKWPCVGRPRRRGANACIEKPWRASGCGSSNTTSGSSAFALGSRNVAIDIRIQPPAIRKNARTRP